MGNVDQYGYIWPTGRVTGGHCILAKGVDIENKRFTLHNSWGTGWGMGGDCFISFGGMEKLLRQKGEAAFALGRRCVPVLP
jgi:C1A family cysteine protease